MIERWLPTPDVRTRHRRRIEAPIDAVWAALATANLLDSRLARLLFALRGLPSRGLTLDRLSELGFAVLERRPPTLIVLGLVARPWRLDGGLRPTDAAHFDAFDEPGYVRIAWSFLLAPVRDGSATLLVTETRVAATDAHARRRFGRYWWVVGPFSGMVRRMMLGAVARGSVHGADRTC